MSAQEIDVRVENEGTVVLFRPLSVTGVKWIRENVQNDPWQWFNGGLVVDHRFAFPLMDGMLAAGLELRGRGDA